MDREEIKGPELDKPYWQCVLFDSCPFLAQIDMVNVYMDLSIEALENGLHRHCKDCYGEGKIPVTSWQGYIECSTCNGTGVEL